MTGWAGYLLMMSEERRLLLIKPEEEKKVKERPEPSWLDGVDQDRKTSHIFHIISNLELT